MILLARCLESIFVGWFKDHLFDYLEGNFFDNLDKDGDDSWEVNYNFNRNLFDFCLDLYLFFFLIFSIFHDIALYWLHPYFHRNLKYLLRLWNTFLNLNYFILCLSDQLLYYHRNLNFFYHFLYNLHRHFSHYLLYYLYGHLHFSHNFHFFNHFHLPDHFHRYLTDDFHFFNDFNWDFNLFDYFLDNLYLYR